MMPPSFSENGQLGQSQLGTMSETDLTDLLDQPIWAIDFQAMLGDVQDFLEFSEANIDWQYRSELQRIEREAKLGFLKDEYAEHEESYKRHLVQTAEHRFTV